MAAPTLIPNRSGERVKTDPRNALKLARLLRAGELTAVHVPDATDEAMREHEKTGTVKPSSFGQTTAQKPLCPLLR